MDKKQLETKIDELEWDLHYHKIKEEEKQLELNMYLKMLKEVMEK